MNLSAIQVVRLYPIFFNKTIVDGELHDNTCSVLQYKIFVVELYIKHGIWAWLLHFLIFYLWSCSIAFYKMSSWDQMFKNGCLFIDDERLLWFDIIEIWMNRLYRLIKAGSDVGTNDMIQSLLKSYGYYFFCDWNCWL